MGSKNILLIVIKVEYREKFFFGNSLDLSVSHISHRGKRHIKLVLKDWVSGKLVPLLPLFPIVVEQSFLQVLSSIVVVFSKDLDILVLIGRHHNSGLINDYKSTIRI